MALAMASFTRRLWCCSNHPILPDLARRCLLPSWISQENYATRSMPSKSRGSWEKCGRRGEMDKEDYGYAWDDHEMGYGREDEVPHLGRKRGKEEMEKKRYGKKSFKLRTEKCLRPFSLDVFLSGKYIHASVMHRVTSKVVAVVSTNAKEFRNQLKSYKDFTACKVVGETLAERAKEADVFIVVYEPRKGEKFEGRLAAVVHTIEANGINVDLD
ncbi:hypothetical protein M758_UG024400 [Ceratodon purpureus]|nr:hypothetical protein M758_UG024400 [Ceratodon purpureus]KAG0593842.1 hypothetical protein M758_UG024400 [Ceratodon purpureus]